MAFHPDVRRAVGLLAGSYALAWVTISMSAGPGPAAYVRLSGSLEHAGYYFALFALASAAGSGVGGWSMDRLGRKPVLAGAHAFMAVGFAAAGLAIQQGSLPLFVAAVGLLAFGMGVVYLTRVAAAELFPPALRGRGMAWVLVSATAGAVVGPLLLVASEPLGAALGNDPRELVWFLAPPLLIASAVLVAAAPDTRRIAGDLGRYHPGVVHTAAGPAGPPPRRLLLAGVATLALAGAAMVTVMGVAGPAVQQHGHGFGVLGGVMAAHFVGMFALSLVVGHVADRIGRRRTILSGLAVLAAGGATLAATDAMAALALGLLLVGLGWSFSYIGATVLLTDVTPLARRAGVLGRADLVAALSQATLAAAGGWWFADRGLAGLGLAAGAIALVPMVLVLLVREPKPGGYADRKPAPA